MGRGGEGGSSRGRISAKKRNERNDAAFIKPCADACAPFPLLLLLYLYLYPLHFLFSLLHICTLCTLSRLTPPRVKIARFWLLTLLLPSSPTIFSFSPIPNFEAFASLSKKEHYPFEQKVTRERMSTRETLSNRGLSPP